jgi:hypothetical protein
MIRSGWSDSPPRSQFSFEAIEDGPWQLADFTVWN